MAISGEAQTTTSGQLTRSKRDNNKFFQSKSGRLSAKDKLLASDWIVNARNLLRQLSEKLGATITAWTNFSCSDTSYFSDMHPSAFRSFLAVKTTFNDLRALQCILEHQASHVEDFAKSVSCKSFQQYQSGGDADSYHSTQLELQLMLEASETAASQETNHKYGVSVASLTVVSRRISTRGAIFHLLMFPL